MDETTRLFQNADGERITAESMALLCVKNVKLDIAPIQIPDITVAQVSNIKGLFTHARIIPPTKVVDPLKSS